jgi:tetratricopeptide (TPR) repeat protein
LSDAYVLLGLFGFVPEQVALPKARAAAVQAIHLDETLSEAHVSLSSLLLHLEWSWSAAEEEARRAIALNPSNAMAHQWYGYYLSAMGRFEPAIAEMRRALELDPLSPNKRHSLAATLYRAGRYDEALQRFREVPDPDANSGRRHQKMAAVYEHKGMSREAVAELLAALALAGKKTIAASVERAYRASGYAEAKQTYLREDLRDLERRMNRAYPRPLAMDIAGDHALLGEREKAFEWLDRAFREREGVLMFLKVDDRLETLRSDPRFTALARRLRLP